MLAPIHTEADLCTKTTCALVVYADAAALRATVLLTPSHHGVTWPAAFLEREIRGRPYTAAVWAHKEPGTYELRAPFPGWVETVTLVPERITQIDWRRRGWGRLSMGMR